MFQSPLTNGAYALSLALFHTLALVYQYNLFLLLRKLKYLHFNIAKYATIKEYVVYTCNKISDSDKIKTWT